MAQEPVKPSEVSEEVSLFDRFAERVSVTVSRAPFFAGCCLFVTLWLIQGFVEAATRGWSAFIATSYQLEINTTTTIITFLMVAVVQNSTTRSDGATQKKLNAVADALADLINWEARHATSEEDRGRLHADADELRAAVGLEHREGT